MSLPPSIVNGQRMNVRVTPFDQVGRSGLDAQSGFIREEFVKELQGELWKRTIKEMSENDPTIASVLYAVEMLIRKVKWDMTPADDSNESLKWADFFKGAMFADMSYSWEDTLAEIISFLTWGWSYMELVYKYRRGDHPDDGTQNSNFEDGLIGWRKWEIRSQDTLYNWEYADDGRSFTGMVQQSPPHYETVLIPIEKSLHFKTTSRKANPEGLSVLRRAYLPWYFKKNIQRIEAIGIERDLAGLPVAFGPKELFSTAATVEEKALRDHLLSMVTKIRRDASEGILFPLVYDKDGHQLYDLKLLSTGGSRQFDTNAIIRRYDESIAATMLADFILLGHNAVGSYALASSKTNLFGVALGAFLDAIQSVLNTFAIPRLARLNNTPKEYWPAVQHGDVESVDLMELGSYISQLSGAGFDLTQFKNLLPFLLQQASLPIEGTEETQSGAELEDAASGFGDEPTDEELDAALVARDEEEAIAASERHSRTFHLPGKHNQKTHGGDSATSADLGDSVTARGAEYKGVGLVVGWEDPQGLGGHAMVKFKSGDIEPHHPLFLTVVEKHTQPFDDTLEGKTSDATTPKIKVPPPMTIPVRERATSVESWKRGTSSDERNAMQVYAGRPYSIVLNKKLRDDDEPDLKDVLGLDKAIARSSLSKDTTLLRSIRVPSGHEIPTVGSTISDKGFSSTTTNKALIARMHSTARGAPEPNEKDIFFEIRAKKGQHGAPLDSFRTEGGKENEILLPRQQKFKVLEVHEGSSVGVPGYTHRIVVEMES